MFLTRDWLQKWDKSLSITLLPAAPLMLFIDITPLWYILTGLLTADLLAFDITILCLYFHKAVNPSVIAIE